MAAELMVARSAAEAKGRFGPSAVTIGNFDGVHRGHQALLAHVVALGAGHGWKPTVLTFHPHPSAVVAPERAPKLLTTVEQRIELMAGLGIRQILVLPFTRELASLEPVEFVQQVLTGAMGARAVVVGDNFCFGRRQAGTTKTLCDLGEAAGYETHVVEGLSIRGRVVSSSEVRRAITSGAVSLAARLLGRTHFLDGTVVAGEGIGRTSTVPTLNLVTEGEVLPGAGVYVTRVRDLASARIWPSVTNVGTRPTFGGRELTVESFLLEGFDGYTPQRIRVEFLRRLREERKFASAPELKAQILRDVARAQALHRRARRWIRAA